GGAFVIPDQRPTHLPVGDAHQHDDRERDEQGDDDDRQHPLEQFPRGREHERRGHMPLPSSMAFSTSFAPSVTDLPNSSYTGLLWAMKASLSASLICVPAPLMVSASAPSRRAAVSYTKGWTSFAVCARMSCTSLGSDSNLRLPAVR